MSKQWEEQTGEFEAVSDDGRTFQILIYTTMTDASSMSNPNAKPLEGLKEYRTSDGQKCTPVGDDTFEIVSLGVTVRRAV